jgi:protoporphyrin/coproporphyrin ferrochelatase
MSIHGAEVRGGPLVQLEPRQYDAVLLVSYGGPEGPDDVMPFLENATRGRGVPRDRLLEVAEHYQHFGGVSPINAQNRALIAALEAELARHGPALPIYFGNRNWHPYLEETIRDMRDAGVQHALALVTSAFSCYSGCRQYREDVIRACEAVGGGAPTFDKLRVFYNHPGFVEANVAGLQEALATIEAGRRSGAHLVFTAHSIPAGMARHSAYEVQLQEASRLVAEAAGVTRWSLAYQSRSGPPQVPWLEPDIGDHLELLAGSGISDVVLLPIGFLSDHMEVLYDLDHEARDRAAELGLGFVRAPSVGTHPAFIGALRELILERMTAQPVRRALGRLGPSHDICPVDCCLEGRGAGRPAA